MNLLSKRLALLPVIFLCVSSSYSQKNFQPGYIITAANDTVKGYLDYRNWEKNPVKIEFSRFINEPATSFSPFELRMFTVGNEIYETGIVTIDDSPYKTEDLTEGLKYNFVTDTVFLLELVKGNESLYYLKDSKNKEHFFMATATGFDLLMYKRYLKKDDLGEPAVVENNRYKGQLLLYLKDCPTIQKEMKDIKYEIKSMVRLFSAYYLCSGKRFMVNTTAVSKPFEFGICAGLSLIKFAWITVTNPINYPISKGLTAGLSLNYVLPRNFGRISFYNELQYSTMNSEGSIVINQYRTLTSGVKLHYLLMHNLVRYKYPFKSACGFVNAGLTSGIVFAPSIYYKKVSTFPPPEVEESKSKGNFNRENFGLAAGTGVQVSKFSFEIRYQLGFKKNDHTRTNSAFILVGYQF